MRIFRLSENEQKQRQARTVMMQRQHKMIDEKKPPADRWRFDDIAYG